MFIITYGNRKHFCLGLTDALCIVTVCLLCLRDTLSYLLTHVSVVTGQWRSGVQDDERGLRLGKETDVASCGRRGPLHLHDICSWLTLVD